jgi:hypothetical protein
MHYLLTPLETHYDQGFGAVANSFVHAADTVASPEHSGSTINAHLPASFLYRHAIELFLKSAIIIFHRKFDLPWGDGGDDPKVPVGQKWKSMYSVHQLQPLLDRVITLIGDHQAYLAEHTRTNWDMPDEVVKAIAHIDSIDGTSTFFRYPVTKDSARDKEKDSIKSDDYLNIVARMGPDSPPQKAFVVLDENDNVIQSYCLDRTKTDAALSLLQQAATTLYGFHAALRVELAGGW